MAGTKGEAKAPREPGKKKVDGLTEVLENIAAMPDHDRAMARRFHSIIERTAPSLKPRLWYGMPAYAEDGKVLCFFQSAAKFKARYATFGFEETAALDDGAMSAHLVRSHRARRRGRSQNRGARQEGARLDGLRRGCARGSAEGHLLVGNQCRNLITAGQQLAEAFHGSGRGCGSVHDVVIECERGQAEASRAPAARPR